MEPSSSASSSSMSCCGAVLRKTMAIVIMQMISGAHDANPSPIPQRHDRPIIHAAAFCRWACACEMGGGWGWSMLPCRVPCRASSPRPRWVRMLIAEHLERARAGLGGETAKVRRGASIRAAFHNGRWVCAPFFRGALSGAHPLKPTLSGWGDCIGCAGDYGINGLDVLMALCGCVTNVFVRSRGVCTSFGDDCAN